MTSVWALAARWLALALFASLPPSGSKSRPRFRKSWSEPSRSWSSAPRSGAPCSAPMRAGSGFSRAAGAIVLTFLAGAELDPLVFRAKWREASAVGVASFFFPFLGCAAAAHYLLGWEVSPSWLAGVAMSTTSVAVVYAVMLEFGFNATDYGKTVLAACFVTDLGSSPRRGRRRFTRHC